MSSNRRLQALVDEHVPGLSHRQRAALVAVCGELAIDALGPRPPIESNPLEAALEVGWAFAVGEDVSHGEHRARRHQFEEDEDDGAVDFDVVERAAVRCLWCSLAVIDSGLAERATRWAVEASVDLVDAISDANDDVLDGWLAWIEARIIHIRESGAVRRDTDERPLMVDPWLTRRWERLDPSDDSLAADVAEAVLEAMRRRRRGRPDRVAAVRSKERFAPWREPTGIPEHLEVRSVGKGHLSTDGKILAPWHQHFGLFEVATGARLFAPERAAAFGMTHDRVFTWRLDRRDGASGTGRGDYDWRVDIHRWPTLEPLGTHTVTTRADIEWCWPVRLDVPAWGEGRVLTLKARSEDEVVRLHLVQTASGAWVETTSGAEARARWSG